MGVFPLFLQTLWCEAGHSGVESQFWSYQPSRSRLLSSLMSPMTKISPIPPLSNLMSPVSPNISSSSGRDRDRREGHGLLLLTGSTATVFLGKLSKSLKKWARGFHELTSSLGLRRTDQEWRSQPCPRAPRLQPHMSHPAVLERTGLTQVQILQPTK